MSWTRSSLVAGVQNTFGGRSGPHESRMQSALEDIREAMLNGLSVPGVATASKLELKVTYANEFKRSVVLAWRCHGSDCRYGW